MKNNSLSGHTGFDTETNRGDHRLTASQLEFEALVIPLLSSLYSTALRMSYVQEQAEELVRTTLFEAFRHFDQYQKDTSFRTWIFAILVTTQVTMRVAVLIQRRIFLKSLSIQLWNCILKQEVLV